MDNIYRSHRVRIVKIIKHTKNEWSFILGKQLTARPGQFVMISLPEAGEVPVTIAGLSETGIEITVRNVGTVTRQLFEKAPNDYLMIRGPIGNVFPFEKFSGKHLILIAGGSGVAAIKALVEYYLYTAPGEISRLDILAGFKSPRQVLYEKDFREWGRKARVILTVDGNEGAEELWEGGIGFVVDFVRTITGIGSDTQIVIVGPPAMMTNTVRELQRHGAREESIWLSFERHMQCGVGKCGHCRIRDQYVCLDGPVFNYVEAKRLLD